MPENDQRERLIGEVLPGIRHLQSDVTDIKAELRAALDRINARFDRVDARFEKMEMRFDERSKRNDDRFESMQNVWVVGLYVGVTATLLLALAHGFKWL